MDYFNELLASYSLLKKRTFKLRYLTEQEEEQVNANALEAARSLVMHPQGVSTGAAPLDQNAFKSTKKKVTAEQVPFAYKNEDGETVVLWTGFGRNTRVMVPNGNFDEMPEPQKSQLIGYFSDGAAANAAGEAPDSPERFAQAELAGTKFDLGDIKQRLHKIYLHYVKFCETTLRDNYQDDNPNVPIPDSNAEDIERSCYKSAFSKVYGKTRGGLAALLSATKIQQQFVDPQKEGDDPSLEITLTEEAAPGLVIDTLATIERLFDFANDPAKFKNDPDICDTFSKSIALSTETVSNSGKKIGKGGNKRVVFYGATSGEGIVIPAQSPEFKEAMAKAEARCKNEPKYSAGLFDTIDLREGGTAGLNAKKGTLHERLSGLMVAMHNLIGTGTKKQKSAVLQAFLAELQKAGEIAKYLKEAIVEDDVKRVASIDEALANDLGLEEDALFQAHAKGDPLLRKFLIDYYKGMKPFLDKVNPAAYVHNGLASTTGGRADQFMVFRDAAHAKKASKAINTKTYAVDREEFINNSENPEKTKASLDAAGVKANKKGEIHIMEMGQKLYSHAKTAKVGEIGRITRLMQLMLGKLNKQEQEKDKHLDDAFMDEVDRRFPLKGKAKAAIKKLDEDLQIIETYINGDQKWTDEHGVEHSMGSQADATVKHMIGSLGWDTISDSEIGDLLKNWKFPKGTHRDRQKLTVELHRLKMASTMKELSTTKDGKKALCRMAFICGGNARDLVQSIFIENGRKHYAVRQNEIFDKFEEAITNNHLTITVKGFSMTIDDGNGFVGSVKTTGDDDSEKVMRNVRTEFDITKSTLEVDQVGGGKKGEDPDGIPDNLHAHTLHKFMKGQMELLETLLN